MKELKRLEKQATSQGWRVERAKNGHLRFFSPDGSTIVVFSGTPSDHRGWKNSMSHMKRAGFKP